MLDVQSARIDQYLAEEPNLMHACKDVNMTITTESVTVVDMDDCNVCTMKSDDDSMTEVCYFVELMKICSISWKIHGESLKNSLKCPYRGVV